jgi:hypothetical protein
VLQLNEVSHNHKQPNDISLTAETVFLPVSKPQATHLAIRFVRPEPADRNEMKCDLLMGVNSEV